MTKRLDAPSAAVRIRVMKRDRFQCTYCGAPGTDAELEVDHIISVANGGSHHMSNLTTACRACNQKKGAGAAPAFARSPQNGLCGMWLHTLKEGKINYQGHVVAVDGNHVLVQLFSWLTGGATNVIALDKEEIYSERVILYASQEMWLHAAEQQNHRDERVGV